MDSKESFASKLASGMAIASKTTSWWPRHCHATAEYLGAKAGGARESDIKIIRDLVGKLALEWESTVSVAARRRAGAALGLMCEHATLEAAFVDAALASDAPAIDRIAEKLLENAKAHAPRYAHASQGFPEARFAELLREHVALFVESVTRRMEGDARGTAKFAQASDENAVALAKISAEWF